MTTQVPEHIDDTIIALFGVLNKQKQEVEAAETASQRKWITNCSFPSVFGGASPINIQTQSESTLVQFMAELLIHDSFTQKAAETLGTKYEGGSWGGFTIANWVEDFKTRVAKIQLAAKKQELAKLEKRLDAIVSIEQRRQMELDAIRASLGV